MIRALAFLVGLFFSGMLVYSFVHGAYNNLTDPPPEYPAEKWHLEPKNVSFASEGLFGRWDKPALQRGFQVYEEVCSGCHSLRLVAFRDLADLGYSEAEIKAKANGWKIEQPSVNPETGEATTRKNVPADKFPSPYLNETAARAANNNALPPDLSDITKARHGGAPYVYSLLTGYSNPPANLPKELATPQGLHFNRYFPNINVAMPPPLTSTGQVGYKDGTKATVPQMAHDVASFLIWTAEPKLMQRKATGIAAVIFLLIATILAYLSYRNIWWEKKHGGASPVVA